MCEKATSIELAPKMHSSPPPTLSHFLDRKQQSTIDGQKFQKFTSHNCKAVKTNDLEIPQFEEETCFSQMSFYQSVSLDSRCPGSTTHVDKTPNM